MECYQFCKLVHGPIAEASLNITLAVVQQSTDVGDPACGFPSVETPSLFIRNSHLIQLHLAW